MFSQKIKTLGHSIRDGAFNSIMVGAGEAYLAAFVLALGFGQIFAGYVAVVPMLIGAVVQLWTTQYKKIIFRNPRRWVVTCSILQGLSLLFLALGSFISVRSGLIVFGLTSLYWAAGFAAGPTWNAWIGSIVPGRFRIRFFSYRSQICHACLLIGLVGSGLFLHYFHAESTVLKVFSGLFIVAGLARFVSAFYLWKHPTAEISLSRNYSSFGAIQKLKERPIWSLLIYLFLIQVGVYISAPFLNPYMLEHLHLDYGSYMILISASYITRTFAYHFFGKLAKQRGPAILLMISAIGIVPLPAMWVFSDSFYALMIVQMLSGIFWAAHELGLFFVMMNKFNGEVRSDVLTFVNLMNTVGMLIGTVIGGEILKAGNLGTESYYYILLLSSVGRAIPLFLLPKLMQIKIPARYLSQMFFAKVIGVRPTFDILKPIFFETKKSRRKANIHQLEFSEAEKKRASGDTTVSQ